MRQDQIDHDLQSLGMRLVQKLLKIGQGAEHRVHVPIVTDIVAKILHRRFEERRYPDRIHAKRCDIIEPLGDAFQVADTIAIAILKAARVDLIDHPTAPPLG